MQNNISAELYAQVRRFLRSTYSALLQQAGISLDDAVQEAMLQIHAELQAHPEGGLLMGGGGFSKWALLVARNCTFALVRAEYAVARTQPYDCPPHSSEKPDSVAAQHEQLKRTADALARCGKKANTLLVCTLNELTDEEAAFSLSLTPRTVRNHIRHCRKRLSAEAPLSLI
ncbi:MAG: hypothetical protein WCV84_03335 [Patescibacteria group bacterium]